MSDQRRAVYTLVVNGEIAEFDLLAEGGIEAYMEAGAQGGKSLHFFDGYSSDRVLG